MVTPGTRSTCRASSASWTRSASCDRRKMALLLGLDIGTTSTIGIVIDDQGATLAVESRPVTFHSDRANWAEEDPEEWWRNVGEICRALIARIGDAGAITAVGVTGMLPAIILLDRDGRPLRRWIQQN